MANQQDSFGVFYALERTSNKPENYRHDKIVYIDELLVSELGTYLLNEFESAKIRLTD